MYQCLSEVRVWTTTMRLRLFHMNEPSIVNVFLPARMQRNAGMSLMEGKEDLFAECKEKIVPTFTVRT